MDEYVEYEEEAGCLAQIKDALAGLIFAPLLIIAAIGLLFWNEGRAVKRAQDLEHGQNKVVSLEKPTVTSDHDGGLVHTTGDLEVDGPVSDPTFGISAKAVHLRRTVEMYQWHEDKETEKVRRNGETRKKTTYRYEKSWDSDLINSSTFKKSSSHQNPKQMPYDSDVFRPDEVRLGEFMVAEELLEGLNTAKPFPLEKKDLEAIPAAHRDTAQVRQNKIYLGGEPRSPEVGDIRVNFTWIEPETVSVVGAQTDSVLTDYTSDNLNYDIGMIEAGTHSSDQMFAEAKEKNTQKTWMFRGLGLILAIVGFSLFFKPLQVVAGSLPLVGWLAEDIVETGALLVSGLLGTALSLVVIAVGWLTYRPLLGIGLLVVVGGCLAGLVTLIMRTRSNRETGV